MKSAALQTFLFNSFPHLLALTLLSYFGAVCYVLLGCLFMKSNGFFVVVVVESNAGAVIGAIK